MATLKHINSKNADYGAAEQYLLFEHDEFTMKPVLDETGRLIPREDYRLSTLNCDGEDGITKLPARKALQAEIEQLISEKDGLYNTYHEQKQRFRELQTVKRNIDQILRREEPHRRKEQSHER